MRSATTSAATAVPTDPIGFGKATSPAVGVVLGGRSPISKRPLVLPSIADRVPSPGAAPASLGQTGSAAAATIRQGRSGDAPSTACSGWPVPSGTLRPLPAVPAKRVAAKDDRPADLRLSQFYTQPDVASSYYEIFRGLFETSEFLMVEPAAGAGSFMRVLPRGSVGIDVDPKCPGIHEADFLAVEVATSEKIAVIGNPPFGRCSNMAKAFFNHAARQASVIALILPRTFRKASVVNRLDRAFHLLREEPVPRNAFLFRSKPYSVPAVFQIWEKRDTPRALRIEETEHPDFEFTTSDRADFAIKRVGVGAGRVHHDYTMSKFSHYFIRGGRNVEAVMTQLDFARFTGDVAGVPSLAKSEIVFLYREWVEASRPVDAGIPRASAGNRDGYARRCETTTVRSNAKRRQPPK